MVEVFEIVQDFFVYHKDIGSKAYHRIKTSDNISHFRNAIIDNLYNILNDKNIFARAVQGYMKVEQATDEGQAENISINDYRFSDFLIERSE